MMRGLAWYLLKRFSVHHISISGTKQNCNFKMSSTNRQSIRSERIILLQLRIGGFCIRVWFVIVDQIEILVLLHTSVIFRYPPGIRCFPVKRKNLPLLSHTAAILLFPRNWVNDATDLDQHANDFTMDDTLRSDHREADTSLRYTRATYSNAGSNSGHSQSTLLNTTFEHVTDMLGVWLPKPWSRVPVD